MQATDELEQFAERLAAPIVKALLGKAAVPDDSPYTTGSIGLLGSKPSQEALEECDTLLVVGSSFPYIEFYPKPGQARGVQIDLDPGPDRPPLSPRSRARRRQPAHAPGAAAAPPAEGGAELPGQGPGGHDGVAGADGGAAEFATAVKYELPIKVVVVKNNSLGQIK